MPHFIIDCSANIITLKTPEQLIDAVYDTAEATGLFTRKDIKVRINPFTYYTVSGTDDDFIHVFAYIMEGRTTEQKADLSKKIVTRLNAMFPDTPVISINVSDFEKASYCNKSMV